MTCVSSPHSRMLGTDGEPGLHTCPTRLRPRLPTATAFIIIFCSANVQIIIYTGMGKPIYTWGMGKPIKSWFSTVNAAKIKHSHEHYNKHYKPNFKIQHCVMRV